MTPTLLGTAGLLLHLSCSLSSYPLTLPARQPHGQLFQSQVFQEGSASLELSSSCSIKSNTGLCFLLCHDDFCPTQSKGARTCPPACPRRPSQHREHQEPPGEDQRCDEVLRGRVGIRSWACRDRLEGTSPPWRGLLAGLQVSLTSKILANP